MKYVRREKDIKLYKLYYDSSSSEHIFILEKNADGVKYYKLSEPDISHIVSVSWALTYWKTP